MGEERLESPHANVGKLFIGLAAALPVLMVLGGAMWRAGQVEAQLTELNTKIGQLVVNQTESNQRLESIRQTLGDVRSSALANERDLKRLESDHEVTKIEVTRIQQTLIRKGLM